MSQGRYGETNQGSFGENRWKCPNCETENTGSVCEICGAQKPEVPKKKKKPTWKCKKCGHDNPMGMNICECCGTRRNANDEITLQKLLPIAIALCAVLIVAVIVVRSMNRPQDDKNSVPAAIQTVSVTEAATQTVTKAATVAPTEAATVAPTEAATVAPTEAATEAPAKIGTIMRVANCDKWITLRAQDDAYSEELFKIPLNAKALYLSEGNNGFTEVEYNGIVGYVMSKYVLTDSTSDNITAYEVFEPKTMKVDNCKESVTLREKASATSGEILQVPLGSRVEVLDCAVGGFYPVQYNGHSGYIMAKYLEY